MGRTPDPGGESALAIWTPLASAHGRRIVISVEARLAQVGWARNPDHVQVLSSPWSSLVMEIMQLLARPAASRGLVLAGGRALGFSAALSVAAPPRYDC